MPQAAEVLAVNPEGQLMTGPVVAAALAAEGIGAARLEAAAGSTAASEVALIPAVGLNGAAIGSEATV